MTQVIDFRAQPSSYRHWKLEYDGPVARLIMDVDENDHEAVEKIQK